MKVKYKCFFVITCFVYLHRYRQSKCFILILSSIIFLFLTRLSHIYIPSGSYSLPSIKKISGFPFFFLSFFFSSPGVVVFVSLCQGHHHHHHPSRKNKRKPFPDRRKTFFSLLLQFLFVLLYLKIRQIKEKV